VSGGGSASLVLGASFKLEKTRRPQLGHADLPSSKRVLQALHSSMQLHRQAGAVAESLWEKRHEFSLWWLSGPPR
jgi:hypothetical protein